MTYDLSVKYQKTESKQGELKKAIDKCAGEEAFKKFWEGRNIGKDSPYGEKLRNPCEM